MNNNENIPVDLNFDESNEQQTKTDSAKKIKDSIDLETNSQLKSHELSIDELTTLLEKNVLVNEKINVEGLEGILRNMDSLLEQYDIVSINSLGEIFNPNLHEAISVIEDETLDEDTITKEIRKGYISHNRVIRPSIVEISKKPKFVKLDGEENG